MPPIEPLGNIHGTNPMAEASFDIDAAENESNSGVYVPRESFDVSSPPATPSMRKGKKSFMTSTPKEKKAYTMLNKRKTHNLTSTLPPVFTQVPAVPLTDKEIVVYFFNSLSRPIVSIRLYERGWGPARICDTLNDHRAIEPPYLRNTCSVKCVTAIRRGLDKWGAEWDTQLRDLLKDADDAVATDAMRIQEDECDEILDIDVLDLLKGLVKYPDEEDDDGIGAGIFTKCVRYCAERQLSWPLSKIHTIALALQEGREPDIAEAHD
ncbi:hypothetical protein K491DRAFT_118594 [Lophiostoma macrostomum CBS 122681]|uniref:Uncharacterized protein n=1 Tax=Lophiostoma macrostomum CBS 122681 TaxID=1314788 RepID=A0A6A6SUR7_9PLEO|nr:hypothetical protein K491DRAFT_118594 [Lophiostoma macrostomum CBS 122681]